MAVRVGPSRNLGAGKSTGLKGRNMVAQGIALDTGVHKQYLALKGQDDS
jgi:hypothetical protein